MLFSAVEITLYFIREILQSFLVFAPFNLKMVYFPNSLIVPQCMLYPMYVFVLLLSM